MLRENCAYLPFLAALHTFQEGADGCDFSFRF